MLDRVIRDTSADHTYDGRLVRRVGTSDVRYRVDRIRETLIEDPDGPRYTVALSGPVQTTYGEDHKSRRAEQTVQGSGVRKLPVTVQRLLLGAEGLRRATFGRLEPVLSAEVPVGADAAASGHAAPPIVGR